MVSSNGVGVYGGELRIGNVEGGVEVWLILLV